MRIKFIIILNLLTLLSVQSQKKSITIADFANWNRIESRHISHNGQFVAYEIKKQKGDGMLIVYNAMSKTNDTISHAYAPQFSVNSDFIAYKIRVPEDSLRKLKLAKTKKEDMPKERLGILNLKNREKSTFPTMKGFQMPADKGNYIAFLLQNTAIKNDTASADSTTIKKAKKSSKPGSKKEIYDLRILNPVQNIKYTFTGVDTFAIANKGEKIVFSTALNDSSKIKALVAFDFKKAKSDTIVKDSIVFRNITLDDVGMQLAYLASNDTAKAKVYSLYYTNLSQLKINNISNLSSAAWPRKWSVSENGNVFFSEDGLKLFFGTASKPVAEPKDSLLDEDKPKLDLWSHTDMLIQPRQLKELARKKKQSYLSMYRIKENECFQLADSTFETIVLTNKNNGEIALGMDKKPYLRSSTWSSLDLADYNVIDLKNGKKITTIKGQDNLSLSATGKYTIWYNSKDNVYYSMDNKTLKTNAITKGLNVSFVDEQHDTPNQPSTYGIAGWTENDEFVLIYDRFDIWKIDPSGKISAINLTNGRKNHKRFRYESTDNEITYIPLKKDILLTVFNEKTNAEGYCSMQISIPTTLKTLIEGDFMLSGTIKSKNSNQLIWSAQTVKDFPEIKYSDLSFATNETISATNPHQKDFIWSTVEMVEWKSFAGDTLRGLLYKPDNFDLTKKYPMMVYFYERSSETSNRYNYPQPSRSIISIPFYNSNEYLVFVPDIVYKTGYPGQSAYNSIVSGVQQLLNTRQYINEKSIGLQGQSWGGYQIAYLITQTNMFAAAMAGAPVSNMTSAYGGIRWGTGMSRMFQYEETQSRIGGTLWEKPLLFLENSPVFMAPKVETPLLIMANDNDGAVPWYQGIEYFMALYRLGKPVWLINYNGMDHNIEAKYWANRIDLSTRMFGFFNYYLKGQPAPEWIIKGIPAIEKSKNLAY